MFLSVLIPTLEVRRTLFARVHGQLTAQAAAAGDMGCQCWGMSNLEILHKDA